MASMNPLKTGLYGLTLVLDGTVIVCWILSLLDLPWANDLLPYQMEWFTVFPYLLMVLLLVPKLPKLLRYFVAGANGYFCILYFIALLRLAATGHSGSASSIGVLIVLGAGATLLNVVIATLYLSRLGAAPAASTH